MILSSCDVHEFPDPIEQEISFTINLSYDTSLPLYKVITHDNGSRTVNESEKHNIRYVIEVYPADEENKSQGRTTLHRFVFIKEDVSTLDYRVEIPLERGAYNFVVWSDYVKANDNDLYYNTQVFEEITLRGDNHNGSNDFRDAFKGSATSEVSEFVTSATIDMQRPMAKFNFISNDVKEFVSNIQSIRAEKQRSRGDEKSNDNNSSSGTVGIEDIDFSEFNILFRYNGFMPDSFNAYTGKPSDASTGVSFDSKIKILENGDAELGFDYIFVNGTESSISVSVEVYDYDGELLSRFKPIEVPLIRSHLTTIKASFLTSGTGGVTIIPDFDGDFNIQVN